MAGTVTPTDSNIRVIRKYTLNWISDAAGDVTYTTDVILSGVIERVNFVPDAVDVPTDLYTVTLTDSDGIDVLQAIGSAGLSSTVASTAIPLISDRPVVVDDALNLVVDAAGNVKKGKISLYFSRKV